METPGPPPSIMRAAIIEGLHTAGLDARMRGKVTETSNRACYRAVKQLPPYRPPGGAPPAPGPRGAARCLRCNTLQGTSFFSSRITSELVDNRLDTSVNEVVVKVS